MMKPRGDGEPRADGEGSHWFCGCVPGAQECHCHDCLLASRDEARAVVTKLNDLNEGLLTTIDQLRSERDEAREVRLAQKDALMFLEGLTNRLLEERRSALKEAAMDRIDALKFPPRASGKGWPDTRSWTDSERLELRELQLEQVLAERDRLRAALGKYGVHTAGCDWDNRRGRRRSERRCNCGLAALLEDKETPGSE